MALQELNTWPSHGQWLAEALRVRERGDRRYTFTGARKRGAAGIESIGVISRLPVVERQAILLGFGGRVAVRCRLVADDREVDFYCAHFHHGAATGHVRLAAARTLLAEMEGRAGVPAILAGDLNGPPGSRALALLSERMRSAFAVANGDEPERTVPTNLRYPPLVLDYILVSGEFHVIDADLAFTERDANGETASDHFGLAATLRLGSMAT